MVIDDTQLHLSVQPDAAAECVKDLKDMLLLLEKHSQNETYAKST